MKKLSEEKAISIASSWFHEGESIVHVYKDIDFDLYYIFTAYKTVIREYTVYPDYSIALDWLTPTRVDDPCFLDPEKEYDE